VGEVWFAILGMMIGAGVVLAVVMLRRRAAADVARELIASAQQDKLEDLDRAIARFEEAA